MMWKSFFRAYRLKKINRFTSNQDESDHWPILYLYLLWHRTQKVQGKI